MDILKIKYYTYFIASLLILVSCNEDDYTGDSEVNFTAPNASYMIVGGNNVSVDETLINPDAQDVGDYGVYVVEASIPEAVPYDTYIDLTQTGGTADSTDYTTEKIRIRPLETTGTGLIKILKTGDLEGQETLTISANTNSPNVNGSEDFNFTINNDYLNDNLILNLEWCNDFEFDNGNITLSGNLGDEIDIDGLIYDSNFNLVSNYSGATGACPEHLEFSGMPDDTYYILIDVYANNLAAYGLGETLTLNASYEQEYFIDNTNLIHNIVLSSDSSGQLGVIATVEKTGNSFVVTAF